MKNNSLPVQSLLKMNQIQSRLKKNKFLNKETVPGSLDGRIFKVLQKSNFIPPRTEYPNFYHWYIFVRQFSAATIQKWISNSISVGEDDDDLVQDLRKTLTSTMQQGSNEVNDSTAIKKTKISRVVSSGDDQNFSKNYQPILKRLQSIQESEKQAFLKDKYKQHEYILEMKLNISSPEVILELENKISQLIEISKFQVISEQNQPQVRLHFKSDLNNCQRLKDSISKWPQIKQVQFKKEKRQGSRSRVEAKQTQK